MKKLLALILALTMLVAVFAACGEKDTPTTASTTEATTTTTEKTTETTVTTETTATTTETTETTTEETTTEATTTETTTEKPPVIVVTGPEAYVDIDFADGKITDAKGNASFTNEGATVGKASVTFGGNTYEVDALSASKDKYVIGKFNKLSTSSEMKAWAEKGFTVEAFYVMPVKNGAIQGIVCGTQNGGWGLAEDKTGKPYFITGGGSKYNNGAYAKKPASTTELVHVVGVYDMANKLCLIYINGELAQQVSIDSKFICGEGNTFNYFCLGADINSLLKGGDFPTAGMTMAGAKIYAKALSAEDVTTVYGIAVDSLK